MTARILLQQPIPVFDRVRKLSRSSADSALYRSAERPRIAAQTIRVLPHGRPRIAARQPSENRRGVSAEKVSFPCHVPYEVCDGRVGGEGRGGKGWGMVCVY